MRPSSFSAGLVLALFLAAPARGLEARLPGWLPQGYALRGTEELPRKAGAILHLRFADGAEALSLFECPPRTRLTLGGRKAKRLRLASGPARLTETPAGQALAWSKDGARFVLVGRLAAADLVRIAESVP